MYLELLLAEELDGDSVLKGQPDRSPNITACTGWDRFHRFLIAKGEIGGSVVAFP